MSAVPWIQVQAALSAQHDKAGKGGSGSEPSTPTGESSTEYALMSTSPQSSGISYWEKFTTVMKTSYKDLADERENSQYNVCGGRILLRKY